MVSPMILSMSPTLAVSMSTGKRCSRRISPHRVKPDMSGSITSRMARSSRLSRTQVRASAAVPQVKTVKPSLFR